MLGRAGPSCEGRDSHARLLLRTRFIVRVPEQLQLRMQRLSHQAAVPASASGPPGRPRPAPIERWRSPDDRRSLQLVLAGIWLLDAVLQCQSFMFSTGFGRMLGATAAGNPRVVREAYGTTICGSG